MDDDAEVIFRTIRQLAIMGAAGDVLSPCSIANEGVVANTCCSFEVFTKLIMYPSLSHQFTVMMKIPENLPSSNPR
jgi:hypothetical protein